MYMILHLHLHASPWPFTLTCLDLKYIHAQQLFVRRSEWLKQIHNLDIGLKFLHTLLTFILLSSMSWTTSLTLLQCSLLVIGYTQLCNFFKPIHQLPYLSSNELLEFERDCPNTIVMYENSDMVRMLWYVDLLRFLKHSWIKKTKTYIGMEYSFAKFTFAKSQSR